MKSILFRLMLLLILLPAAVFATANLNTEESPAYEKCTEWKEVCYKKQFCTQRSPMRENGGCYRCVKPGSQVGFHVYPRELDRKTCNENTAQYLSSMGYRCYHPYESTACQRSIEREYCDSVCVSYEK